MRVTYYFRPKTGSYGSIERLFGNIIRALPNSIQPRPVYSRFSPKTLWGFVYTIFEANLRQGDVNHITGDVHIVSLLLKKKKTLLTIHDLVPLHTLAGLKRWIVATIWYRLAIQRVSYVATISQATKEELLQTFRINPDKVLVVHDCVADEFQPVPRPFNEEKPVVLQVGTKWTKNVERVAVALQGVRCHLRIIGKLNESQTTVLEQNRIDYSNVINISDMQVVEEYEKCDLLLFASLYEGFGLPIVEAQAIGRPVVTSNLCSMPEVAGDAACIIDPYDPEQIRGAVERVIKDLEYRENLIQKGFENVKRFKTSAIVGKYLEIYAQLAG